MRRVLAFVAVLLVAGCGFDGKAEPQKKVALKREEPKAGKPRARDELKTLLADRSMEQVKDLLGKPDSTDEVGISRTWSYSAPLSFDPVTGKTDGRVVVWFRDGSVDRLTFTPGR